MAQAHHTVIFVPHARAKLRKWRVTNFQIFGAAGSLLVLTLAATFVLWFHFRTGINPDEMARLKRENEKLREVNQSFESSIKKLQGRLVDYEDRTRQLAIVAGVENLGVGADAGGAGEQGEAGVGGGTSIAEASAPDLAAMAAVAAMDARAKQLAGRLDTVESKLEERVRWISSTPAIAPVKGILTSGFGYRSDPMSHEQGIHQGVDIAAPAGQPVHASADGIVLRAGEVTGLGRAVFLAHGYGLVTRYGHMSRVDVHPGQRLKRGDVVGLVGNTGRSTGYHLHYEVRLDGAPVNPLGYILDDAGGPL
jgi:murein DD-endopeptidase MepM/ murein hydrolase activator NlpD